MQKKINKKILIISSDKKLNEVLTKYVSKYDFDFSVIDSGSTGIQRLRDEDDYSVVVITQLLYDIAGSKAISILKKQNVSSKFILVTNTISKADYNSFVKDGADIIHSSPLNIGKLLLDIEEGAREYQHKDVVEIPNIIESPEISMTAEFHFTIRDISETGCLIRSSFPVEVGSILILESIDISDKLSLATNTIFPMRVMNCKLSNNSKGYDLGGIFVGMQKKISVRLKQACLSAKGFKFTSTDNY